MGTVEQPSSLMHNNLFINFKGVVQVRPPSRETIKTNNKVAIFRESTSSFLDVYEAWLT